MQYAKLGRTGLDISPIAIGCMGFGDPSRGYPSWSRDEEASRRLIRHALEAGINFFDTANLYSNGSSEEILGRSLKDFAHRENVVIATKLSAPMRDGPNSIGLSRKAIMTEVDMSLRRLGTDYIDLYQIHRRDRTTPWEETLEALNDIVKAGKVRYLGASSMMAWEFGKALHLQKSNGWARFVSMQDTYNLLDREEEREMHALCRDYLPRSSWPIRPMTPIICVKPSPPRARSPSSPTTRHARSSTRWTTTSMPSVTSSNAASQSSSSSAALQPASKRPLEIIAPSSLSQPSSFGCGKCPHALGLRVAGHPETRTVWRVVCLFSQTE